MGRRGLFFYPEAKVVGDMCAVDRQYGNLVLRPSWSPFLTPGTSFAPSHSIQGSSFLLIPQAIPISCNPLSLGPTLNPFCFSPLPDPLGVTRRPSFARS